jgi:hypothetical protein
MFEGFNSFLSGLGGLLGFGGNPQMPPAGPEYYAEGAAAGAATNPPQAPRPDPFARFTPEQRTQLGLGYLADAAAQFGGRKGTAASALMNAFDVSGGRNPVNAVAAQQEPKAQFLQLQQLPPVTMPPMRPMAINIPRRTALQVPSLLGV